MPSSKEMLRLQRQRPQHQVWVYFHLENPIVTSYIAPHKHRSDLDNVFNWTMTFMRESDIFHPYGFYLPLTKGERSSVSSQNHAIGKTKLAVWLGSGCGQVLDERKVRMMYIHNLRKLIPVDIYGNIRIVRNISIKQSETARKRRTIIRPQNVLLSCKNTSLSWLSRT